MFFKKKKLSVPLERTSDEEPFQVYEILTEEEKRRYHKERFVSPIFGQNVKDDLVIPVSVSQKKDMDKYDSFRTKPRLSRDDRIKKYGTAYPEFDLVKGKNLQEVLESQEHNRKKDTTKIVEASIIDHSNDGQEHVERAFDSVDSFAPSEEDKPKMYDFLKEEDTQAQQDPQNQPDKEPNEPSVNQDKQSDEPDPSKLKKAVKSNPKEDKNYQLPPITLFEQPSKEVKDNTEFIDQMKEILNRTFDDFGVGAHVHAHTQGPTVTRFEIALDKGVKVTKVTQLQDNLKMALSAEQIRIEAPIPGKPTVGIEIPNKDPETVHFYNIINRSHFKAATEALTIALGLDIDGNAIYESIKRMPHGLIAGQTGSGKSVSINTILISLLMRYKPSELKLLLIDPKMVELTSYSDIPHLITPVITDAKAATAALNWVVDEMERRFQLFADNRVRDINGYNEQFEDENMPYLVIVVDELADLMMVASQQVEHAIMRITQKARAAGIHLLVATQRPSTDVIKGTIKSNIPSRIAFSVASHIDSQTILDSSGAEKLIGRGDMLLMSSGKAKKRLQGAFINDKDITSVTDFIREQLPPNYLFTTEDLVDRATKTFEQDDRLLDVAKFVIAQQEASINKISKTFNIGFNRAQSIVESLESAGIVGSNQGSKAREVLVNKAEAEDILRKLS